MSKLNEKYYTLSELTDIDSQLAPLKVLADKERVSIYGLTGMLYTPHIDAYMQVCIKKSEILACLKRQKIIPLSEIELISATLDEVHSRARSNKVVEHEGENYLRRFLPLKLSKSGKIVRKWARVWLLQQPNGKVDPNWEAQVREIWPTYFLIRTIDL